MKRLLMMLLTLVSLAAGAQSADKLYDEGKELYEAKKYAAAFPKLKAAAEKGHRKAQYRLGRCYDKGYGVAEDDQQAFQWYSKSAAQDYAKAQYRLGKCYKDGEGTSKDKQKAFQYFTKAARQENCDGQYQLGKCYLKGKGTAADEKKAKTWLTRAVKNEKGGSELLAKLRREAAEGDEDSKAVLKLIGK